jgi:hypothetical protein
MSQNNINRIQENILLEIVNGQTPMPETRNELHDLVLNAITVIDYELEERKDLHDCLRSFLSTSLRRCDDIGFVFRSVPISVLAKRKYFERLQEKTKRRGVEAMAHVELTLVANQSIVRVGSQIRVTVKGEEYFKELKREIGVPSLPGTTKQLTE